MSKVLTLAAGFVVIVGAMALADDKKEGAEVIIHRVTADEIAKEFKDDTEAAKKKYNPKPPKGVAGGAIIEIDGMVAEIKGKDVYLKNEAGLIVHVRAKKLTGDKTKAVKGTGGKFQSYRRKTILIECEEVKFVPFAGKEK